MKTTLQSVVIGHKTELHESKFNVVMTKETDYSHMREKARKLKKPQTSSLLEV